MFNSPYGLFTPENYWMIQNMSQSNNFMPYMRGAAPNFTGVAASSASASTPKTKLSAKQQLELIDAELKKAYELKKQTADVLEVTDGQNVGTISKAAYDAKTGYVASDGKNDGKIGFWKGVGNFFKGCTNLVTNMFCDENGKFSVKQIAKTAVIGGAMAAAAYFVPFVGPVLLGVGLLTGGYSLVKGAINAANAKDDLSAERAWQDIHRKRH